MRLVLVSKARTLAQLQSCIRSARIAPLIYFTVAQWLSEKNACLEQVESQLGGGPWIVRSSCNQEDGETASKAGAFLSVLNVFAPDLENTIERVIGAYGEAALDDEVLVQPMLQNVVRAGVAFSHDPNTCSPYRTVNWTEGENTTAVTAGLGGRVWQRAASAPGNPPLIFASLILLLDELLELFGGVPLDCEFAVTQEGKDEILWLLQARPMILRQAPESAEAQELRLQQIHEQVARGMQSRPFLMGRRTAYGVMPDWNPAEIVGIRPRPLALSLYRELVTDSIWAYQRHNYGYRNLRSFALMPHFFGLPYIDVRLSFNSFIPADVDDGLAARLVDYYVDRLLAEPALHDKVEFEIVYSCYTLDLTQRLEKLAEAGFSSADRTAIADSLRRLTNRIVHPKNGLWRSDAAKLDTLIARREALLASDADPLERIYWLLEDAKRYGTLPFAGLARAAFIAVQMLRSLVSVGVFSQVDYDAFIGAISTVSGQLSRDRALLDKTTFLARYGHLRPGTYDILAPRYDEAPDLYFDWNRRTQAPEPAKAFALTMPQLREMVKLLEVHGLDRDPMDLLDFMQSAIELRELAKFHFTRNLSDALSLMAELGGQWGFSRDEMSYCDVRVFGELHVAAAPQRDLVSRSIAEGKQRYADTLKLSLPPLISHPEDLWSFEWPDSAPNFITQKAVTAPVANCGVRDQLEGAIICIPNADPGFDWLFAYPIAGLITAWGGANSHMAIRAGELGLPAVIGAGEILYAQWSRSKRLRIDCAGRRVEVLA